MQATQLEIPKSVGSFTFCVLSSVCCPLFSTFSNLKQLVGGGEGRVCRRHSPYNRVTNPTGRLPCLQGGVQILITLHLRRHFSHLYASYLSLFFSGTIFIFLNYTLILDGNLKIQILDSRFKSADLTIGILVVASYSQMF